MKQETNNFRILKAFGYIRKLCNTMKVQFDKHGKKLMVESAAKIKSLVRGKKYIPFLPIHFNRLLILLIFSGLISNNLANYLIN